MSIEDRVYKVFVDGIGLDMDELSPEACLKDDLGIDSTEMVEVVVALEKEFGARIPDGVVQGASTIRDIVHYVSKAVL